MGNIHCSVLAGDREKITQCLYASLSHLYLQFQTFSLSELRIKISYENSVNGRKANRKA